MGNISTTRTSTTRTMNILKSPLVSVIDKIEEIGNSTASLSKKWILTLKPDVTYRDKPIAKVFLKWFVDYNSTTEKFFADNIKSLHYELQIYIKVITPLLDRNICPFFVRCVNTATGLCEKDITDILTGHYTYSDQKVITQAEAQKYVQRVAYSFCEDFDEGPSLSKRQIMSCPRDLSHFRYDYILTEVHDKAKTVAEFLPKF